MEGQLQLVVEQQGLVLELQLDEEEQQQDVGLQLGVALHGVVLLRAAPGEARAEATEISISRI